MALSLQRYTDSDSSSHFNHLLKERLAREKQRSLMVVIKDIDHLPENLIVEILSWLPVKDLLQFKSICKSWYSIISSPRFITKHLKNYYSNNNSWKDCLLVQYYVSHAEIQLYELLLDGETPRVLAKEVLDSMPMYCSYVCGPCNGIYYLYQYNWSCRALWNPAINELKVLPRMISKPGLPSNLTYASYEVYGFGVDLITSDYKVVVIKGYWSTNDEEIDDVNKFPVSVLVYSLRTDSWRYCGDLSRPYELESNKCYMYVNGCCYWFGSYEFRSDDEVIISFDMGNDTFIEIDVPDYSQPSSKCLGIYDNSLAFLSVHETNKNFDVWTWNEECWIKKLTVGPFPEIRNPVGNWKDNRLLLECKDGKLVLYDPETQEKRDLAFQKDIRCKGAFAYMESLVSIKENIQ